MLDLVTPDDSRYGSVRHVYRSQGAPATVVLPRSAEEVVEALAFARDAKAPFSIRSGGHGMSSTSTNNGGTVIDLRALASIERVDDRRVRLGPGARWGHVAHALHPWGLAISSGDSGDVGVGGLATTGGIGLMGRAHGLTIDSLLSVDIVTADGKLATASDTQNPDLFWAVRGAGANFGIVTSFEFRASTTAQVVRATFAYTLEDLATFLPLWGKTVKDAPRAISAFLYLGAGASLYAQAMVVFAGDDTDAASQALGAFAALPGMVGQRAHLVPYSQVPVTTDAPYSGQQPTNTHSGLVTHLDGEVASRLRTMARSGAVQSLHIRSTGGAINDIPEDATAFAHRHQNFSLMVGSQGDIGTLRHAWEPVYELIDGMYLSFESDHTPKNIRDAFPPKTLARLQELKSKWDPDDIFNQNFDVSVRE